MAVANEYDIGDVVRLQGLFTSTGSTAENPTQVTMWVKAPSSTVATFVSGSTQINNPTVGTFEADYIPISTGVYAYRIYSTGSIVTAEDGIFRVKTPLIASTGT